MILSQLSKFELFPGYYLSVQSSTDQSAMFWVLEKMDDGSRRRGWAMLQFSQSEARKLSGLFILDPLLLDVFNCEHVTDAICVKLNPDKVKMTREIHFAPCRQEDVLSIQFGEWLL